MSTIRPLRSVVTVEESFAFEVNLEQNEHSCTWMILDNERRHVDHGEVDHVPSQEASSHFTLTRDPLPPGEYFLVLYRDPPEGHHNPLDPRFALPPMDADNDWLLSEDSFAVVGRRFVNVNLMRDGHGGGRPVHPDRFVTFAGFQAYLGTYLASLSAPAHPLAFGGAHYEQVRDAAREYVRTSAVLNFDDLMPPGYEQGRQRAAGDAFRVLEFPDAHVLPGVELIWNYWQEEGMLVQTLNVILARFQNRRLPGRDPLARFDVTPLLPLRGELWGFAEDESHRLTVRRRAAEYEYEYGLSLIGRAVPPRYTNVERRSAFLETFHQVLHQAHVFFKELDDLTIQADAFPLYRALRDCHLVLSQGSHNQYGEMAVAARTEFLIMQELLARSEMREFLGGRPMTPYPEDWMDRVDTMKSIQGWDDASIMHYHDLATLGEQLVLTIRLGNWAGLLVSAPVAAAWATTFREHIQKYVAAYRSVTGVDLARTVNAQQPSGLIQRRLLTRRRGA